MGKKKSKKKSRNTAQFEGQEPQSALEGLGINVQQIGATLAGVLIGEIVEAATAQLVQRLDSSKAGDLPNHDLTDKANPSHALESVLGDDACEGVGTAIGDSAKSVRSTASDLTPSWPEAVDVLKDVGQRLKQKSIETLGSPSEALLEGVTSGLKTTVATLAQGTALEKPTKSKKKGKKKKHKKS